MRREAAGGWAMIAGAVMGLTTMAFHPTHAGSAALAVGVHSLALAAVPISFYGGWMLTRRLADGGPAAELALAFYALSSAAALLAATVSGLVGPELIARQEALGVAADALRIYNHALNQAFAKVLVAASSAAIGLWSMEMLRTRRFRRGAGILGCAVAALALLALLSGHLTLDVHGFGAVLLAQAAWLILAGAELRGMQPAAADG
jgi:hypothetical protein